MRRSVKRVLAILLVGTICLTGCSAKEGTQVRKTQEPLVTSSPEAEGIDKYPYAQKLNMPDDKYRTYYEVFVYSFCDGNEDGIGDLKGLISKLDYLNDGDDTTDTDLGYTGIWLMPIMPSTTYHKYDVTDYCNIDPEYGTLEEFKELVAECDKRGINVIIDFVMNHTSTKHPWFQKAREYLNQLLDGEEPDLKECPYVAYYNFSYGEEGKGVYSRLDNTNWYYECTFWDQMPDLNLDNPAVRKEFENIVDFWMDLGVSGFRMDAAKEYFTGRSSKNIEVLKWFNDYVKGKDEKAYIVAEVWEDSSTYMQYYQSGIDSVFNFDFSQNEGSIGKTLISSSTKAKQFEEDMIKNQRKIAENTDIGIDAPFFTNHDVARAVGYFAYNEEKIKMAAGMNLMMSGCTFTYYGEEIGMTGSGIDENKRAPMYWNDNGEGMTAGPANREQQKNRFPSEEAQENDPLSIYSYYKRAVRLRNENPEIARGTVAAIGEVTDEDICAITKTYDGSTIIMLYNISEEEKTVTLSKDTFGYEGIRGYLSATGEEVTIEGDKVTLPAYSIVILK